MPSLSLHSPLGEITLHEGAGDDGAPALVALDWGWGSHQEPTPLLVEAKRQLDAYFDGTLARFSLPLAPDGTPFQRRVWAAMQTIPKGETRRYRDLAAMLGSGPRAIGGACGRNPIPVIIPCHRVLAANGLGGYSGHDGLDTKRALLRLEGVAV